MFSKEVGLRDKHRVLRAVWAIISIGFIGYLVFTMYGNIDLTVTLLTAFLVGLMLFILYELVLLYELYQEDADPFLIKNSFYQLYISKISLVSGGIALMTGFIFNLETDSVLLLLSVLALSLLLVTFPYARYEINSKAERSG